MLDFAGADPERQRAKGAMRAGVAVAADNGQARLRQPELGANHVHNALQRAEAVLEPNTELFTVALERVKLSFSDGIGDGLRQRPRRCVVIHRRDRQIWTTHAAAGEPQALKGLRRRDFVDQVQIDVEQRGLARHVAHDVSVPDFLEEGPGHWG